MKKSALPLALICCGLFVSYPSYALFGFGSDDSKSSEQLTTQLTDSLANNSALIRTLKEDLNVSTTQAAGGASALLALAANKLPAENAKELEDLSPKLSSTLNAAKIADGSISSLDSVKEAFEKLGLDSSMIDKFSPILLDYLSKSGASNQLLNSVTDLWQ